MPAQRRDGFDEIRALLGPEVLEHAFERGEELSRLLARARVARVLEGAAEPEGHEGRALGELHAEAAEAAGRLLAEGRAARLEEVRDEGEGERDLRVRVGRDVGQGAKGRGLRVGLGGGEARDDVGSVRREGVRLPLGDLLEGAEGGDAYGGKRVAGEGDDEGDARRILFEGGAERARGEPAARGETVPPLGLEIGGLHHVAPRSLGTALCAFRERRAGPVPLRGVFPANVARRGSIFPPAEPWRPMSALAQPPPSAGAPARPRRVWWHYLDAGRTHEVLIEWREPEGLLHVRESSACAPDAVLEESVRAQAPWEVRVGVWTLEARLAALGSYSREASGALGWRVLAMPLGATVPDARPNDVLRHKDASMLHHYHDARGAGGTLLAALRTCEERFVLVRAAVDGVAVEVGRIELVHARLPAPLARSAIARDQLALEQSGLQKLVSRDDYRRAYGGGGDKRAVCLADELVARVRAGHLERPATTARDEDVFAEFLVRLSDPRLLALHHRFLDVAEEARLLREGPIAIRRAIAQKRAGAEHGQRHLLTILEASLLARERLQAGRLLASDPEVRALTRLAFYL